jgi:diguanylate cyclase (GGDEF)-like protein
MTFPTARRCTLDSSVPKFERMTSRFSSIAVRLVAVVVITGMVAFGILGILTSFRLHVALQEQASALGQLSERQLAVRLESEAKLARARLESLGAEVATRLRQIAQRSDIIQAIESKNEVAIREPLYGIIATGGLDRLLAFGPRGEILASDDYLGLIQVHGLLPTSGLRDGLKSVLSSDNSRNHPTIYEQIVQFDPSFADALHLAEGQAVAYVAIVPIFEDFGDVIGALIAIRTLDRSEHTLEKFTTLADVGVVISKDKTVVSSTGPRGVTFSNLMADRSGLIHSDKGDHVARCVAYAIHFDVCTFTAADAAHAWRDQMLRIGVAQTRSTTNQFLVFSALTLGTMVVALLLVVRHTTRGLSALASAARAVAAGNLQVEITTTGVAEVKLLSSAFTSMLANLRRSMGRIEQLAYSDTITMLPNRAKFLIDAPALIASGKAGVAFYIDLDGFKSINDTYGHHSGDTLLKQVAERLATYFEDKARSYSIAKVLVARLSGDEFVAILADSRVIDEAGQIAQGAIDALNVPFDIGGPQVSVGASIGITSFPRDGGDFETILVNADLAMYAAKQCGRNSHTRFTAVLAEQAKKRIRLENELKVAIRERGLTVYYQPKVECRSGRICGVEALVRWRHPELGFISPAAFLPIAQEIGLIGEIDKFVIGRAIEEINSLIKGGIHLQLAVNVTASEIESPDFLKSIAELVTQANFPPSSFELEITESDALQNPETVRRNVATIRQLGVRLAIDDFGAGYSNLATLARLPIDTLKLDRALVSGVGTDREKEGIVRVALRLANELGLDSVAEGVETADEYRFIAAEGANMVQGFFCSPPVAFTDLVPFIASYNLRSAAFSEMALASGKEQRPKIVSS